MGSQSGVIVKAAAAAQAIIVIAATLQNVYGQSCGGSLTGSGTFTSPNYPAPYPDNVYCQWNLTASDDNSAVQIFFGDLGLEIHFDVLEIYSGGVLLEQYQYFTRAHTAVYSRNVTIVFRTDYDIQGEGFTISFNSTSPKCGMACYDYRCITWTPNFPLPYPQGSSCNWIIDSLGSLFALESTTVSPTPFTGTLEIARNYTNGSLSVETYRSPAPIPPVLIGERFAHVTFTSTRCRVGTGFMLTYSQKLTQCGQQLVGQGSFSTPNYPSNYGRLTICVWHLKASPGMRVELTVQDMYVETGYDYVRIYVDNQLVNSYTGSHNQFTLTLGGDVTVVFQSETSIQERGMQAIFVSVP